MQRILRPRVAWVAPAQLRPHLGVALPPERREVRRHRDGPAGGREQVQHDRHPALEHGGCRRPAEGLLHPHGEHRGAAAGVRQPPRAADGHRHALGDEDVEAGGLRPRQQPAQGRADVDPGQVGGGADPGDVRAEPAVDVRPSTRRRPPPATAGRGARGTGPAGRPVLHGVVVQPAPPRPERSRPRRTAARRASGRGRPGAARAARSRRAGRAGGPPTGRPPSPPLLSLQQFAADVQGGRLVHGRRGPDAGVRAADRPVGDGHGEPCAAAQAEPGSSAAPVPPAMW